MSKGSYTKEDCIEALQKATEELGHSPTCPEYRDLDIYPTYSVFHYKFGSWNEAKKAAGIEQYSQHRDMIEKPDNVKIDGNWEDKSPSYRFKIRQRAKLAKYKIEKGCSKCGYDKHPSALDFHHLSSSEKNYNIGEQIGSRPFEEVQNEIDKCEIVCSNCHRAEESLVEYIDISEGE